MAALHAGPPPPCNIINVYDTRVFDHIFTDVHAQKVALDQTRVACPYLHGRESGEESLIIIMLITHIDILSCFVDTRVLNHIFTDVHAQKVVLDQTRVACAYLHGRESGEKSLKINPLITHRDIYQVVLWTRECSTISSQTSTRSK